MRGPWAKLNQILQLLWTLRMQNHHKIANNCIQYSKTYHVTRNISYIS